MYRKAFALMALVVVAGLVLTACAPQTVTVTVPVKETVQVPVEKTVVVPAERVTVRLSGWAANPQETALLESLLYRFSVENPDIVVKYEPITAGLINALTNAQPGQASVWTCGGCPVSIRNITEALLTNDVERHTADGMERTANLSGMIPVFLIRHV